MKRFLNLQNKIKLKFVNLIIVSIFVLLNNVNAQGPNLSLVGGSPSFSKGNINTEVLSEIIQQKQEEVSQKIVRNAIVKSFNNTSYNTSLNNFSSYYYLFNLMKTITSGKNKTIITNSIIESSTEFAYIFGLSLYIQKSMELNRNTKMIAGVHLDSNFLSNAKVSYLPKKITVSENVKEFNILLDLCFDIILNNTELQKDFKFKENLNDNSFYTWYQSNNAYIIERNLADPARLAALDSLRNEVSYKLNELANLANNIDTLNSEYKQLLLFYAGLKKSDFKKFSINQSQYYSMKYILKEYAQLAKNQYENDIMFNVISFMLDNTMLEYASGVDGTRILESNTTNQDLGYLYVDIESLISEIYQKIGTNKNKGISVYISPFISIGTNFASFLNTNKLDVDNTGLGNNLSNLYFASEKIGLKWKIWNWEYTHSHSVGESYRYYNKQNTSRYWKRPQPKPTVSDIHFIAYGSGLLYNIANLKSSENFNYAIVGTGLGLTMFNGLSANVSIACPYTNSSFNSSNMFLNIGFDIPIIEYIAGLRK